MATPVRPHSPPCRAGGFTYIALLLAVVVMGVGLAAVAEVWSLALKREKERELLFVGGEFRRAITRYAQHAEDATNVYPRRLEDLINDPRQPGVRRFLRKIYADPLTGTTQWGLLRGTRGEIYGVHSLAEGEPIKRANFDPADSGFEGKRKYTEWVFSPAGGRPREPVANTVRNNRPGRFSPR